MICFRKERTAPDSQTPSSHHGRKSRSGVTALKVLAVLGCMTFPACTAMPGRSHPAAARSARGPVSWPDGLSGHHSLTTEQWVATALWNSPDYQAALADLGIARSEVIRAGQIANPSLASLFPAGAKTFEAAVKLPVDAIWLRPRRIRVARIDYAATAEKLMQSGSDLARDVRIAAAKVTLLRNQSRAAGENAGTFAELLRIAETREKAGEHGGMEASRARADAALARQEKERLEFEERVALEHLRSVTGMAREPGACGLVDRSDTIPGPASPATAASEAIRNRPDVRAAELSVLSAAESAGLAKAEAVALTISAKFTDGSGTQPGFDLPLPVFNQNQAARALADARLNKNLHLLAAARHRAAAEAREASAKLTAAKSVAAGWDRVLPELEAALQLARTAVTAGESQPLVALEAARRLAEAKIKSAESRFRVAEAAAEYRRATGKS